MATRFQWLVGGTLLPVWISAGIAAGGAGPAAGKKRSRTKTTAVVSGAPRQIAPSFDRYKEIQESLIAKGYMQGPATGVWDQNSMDAMRKFQEEQKLEPTGKITAKALINLGLGPKDESAPTSNTPANK